MTADLKLTALSDHFHRLPSAPAEFSAFYHKLIGLRFPLDVAEILELRYLFNHAVDHTPDSRINDAVADKWSAEVERLGIEKPHHISRLLKLLAMLRDLQVRHLIHSRDTEAMLRKALSQNETAAARSKRYAKIAFAGTVVSISFWAVLYQPAWWLYTAIGVFAYFFADYFYSLSILKREHAYLSAQLQDLLARRVLGLNWPALIKNVSLILGYAKISGVEAFVLENEFDDVQRHYS